MKTKTTTIAATTTTGATTAATIMPTDEADSLGSVSPMTNSNADKHELQSITVNIR